MDVHWKEWPRSVRPTANPVVCVVACASAVHDLQHFLVTVEPACGLTFVVILRDDAGRDPDLATLLGRNCVLPVVDAQPGAACEPNRVYIIPPHCTPTIQACRLQFERSREGQASRAGIDGLLVSLAKDQEENAGCIILSCTGSDGVLGVRAVKLHGGICLARSDAGLVGAMRDSPVAGFADLALPIDELAPRLCRHFLRRRDLEEGERTLSLRAEIVARMPEIQDILRIRTGNDFNGYRDGRVAQRIERRMHLLQIADAVAFVSRLKQDPREADLLFEDLLLGLTEFFGDRNSFEALAASVAPQILAERTPGRPIRIWVAACATGEEAYATGMIFRELIAQEDGKSDKKAGKKGENKEEKDEKIEIQIFASDIDERSLAVARNGRYSTAIEETVSAQRLQRFFVREDGSYRVSSELRDSCLFTKHDLLRDSPFSRMDLVVCRNLLIQLGPDLQDRLLSLLHYALRKGGYLFIGESENVTKADFFETIDPAHRIFRKLSPEHARHPRFPPSARAPTHRPLRACADGAVGIARPGKDASLQANLQARLQANLQERAEHQVLELFAPAHLIVNAAGQILYTSGRTGKYLELAQGAPDDNIFSLARAELREELRFVFERAVATQRSVVSRNLTFGSEGERRTIDLMVQPLDQVDIPEANYLVLFRDVGSVVADGWLEADHPEHALVARVRQLERDLRTARDIQQISTEELESSNEELRSANEEMSSLNEELQLVNAELAVRVDELSSALSDIRNLLESTQIAAIFLDRGLRLRLFTPAATEFYHFAPGDLGRPISDLRPLIDASSLEHDARRVMGALEPVEREVKGLDRDARYRMRVLPYRTAQDVIAGVVVTFTG